MADEYRYTGSSPLQRGGDRDDIAPGDTFEPTQLELDAFGDLLEPVLSMGDAMGDDASASNSDTSSNDARDDGDASGDADDAHDASDADDDDALAGVDIDAVLDKYDSISDPSNYRELQTTAGQFDDIDGTATKEELRRALARKAVDRDG